MSVDLEQYCLHAVDQSGQEVKPHLIRNSSWSRMQKIIRNSSSLRCILVPVVVLLLVAVVVAVSSTRLLIAAVAAVSS